MTSTPKLVDLEDALSLLETFGKEFWNADTIDFVSAAQSFAKELRDYGPWSHLEVKGLAFWFGNVFAAYRRAVVYDIATSTSTRRGVLRRFDFQDAELSGILRKLARLDKSSQQISSKSAPSQPRVSRSDTSRLDSGASSRKGSKTPPEISALIPRQNGLQLCLKFVSTKGCPSKSTEQCVRPFLAHFEPSQLHPKVQAFVQERFGGLQARFASD